MYSATQVCIQVIDAANDLFIIVHTLENGPHNIHTIIKLKNTTMG